MRVGCGEAKAGYKVRKTRKLPKRGAASANAISYAISYIEKYRSAEPVLEITFSGHNQAFLRVSAAPAQSIENVPTLPIGSPRLVGILNEEVNALAKHYQILRYEGVAGGQDRVIEITLKGELAYDLLVRCGRYGPRGAPSRQDPAPGDTKSPPREPDPVPPAIDEEEFQGHYDE